MQLQGASVNTITVNQKDIVTGQKMNFGAGEETSMQFDPRAQVNIVTPGSINMKAAQDFKLGTLGCISLFAVGGPGALVKNRLCGMSLSTRTQLAAGGTAATDIISSGFTTVKGTDIDISAKALVDIVGADAGLTATAGDASLTGTTATITGRTQVKIEGSMIYLN